MNKQQIYIILLDLLDLTVLQDGTLFCPMSNTVFILDGKYIKLYSDDQIQAGMYDKNSEVPFEPMHNYRLIERIFQFFLCSLRDNEDVLIDDVVKLPRTGDNKSIIYIMYQEDYSKLYSDPFHNTCLCFIDIIFKYNNYDIDLHEFDN